MHENEIKIRSKLALLESGLYVVRYASCSGDSVCVTLNTSPIGRGNIDFFPAEGVSRNSLTKPGDCIVVRVKGGKTGLLITEFSHSAQSAPVELRIDRIGQAEAHTPAALQDQAPAPSIQEPASLNLLITGHIEGLGDTTVSRGWLGAPHSLKRIEGFSVDTKNIPEGLVVAYSSRSGANDEPQIATKGDFVGTRRQAKPITAVAFALSGASAKNYEIVGQVVFAANPPLPIVSGQELSGPTGTEQLVALQLEIRPKASTQTLPSASPWENTSRTHVFTS